MRCGHLRITLRCSSLDKIAYSIIYKWIIFQIQFSVVSTRRVIDYYSLYNHLLVSDCTLRFSIGITHLSSRPSIPPPPPPVPINRVSDFRNSPLLRCLTWKLFVIDHNNYPSSTGLLCMNGTRSQWSPSLSQSIILSPPV